MNRKVVIYRSRRAGLSVAEAFLIVAIVAICGLFVLMALPRSRENARLAGCQRNLSQIGFALLQYHQIHDRLPLISQFGEPADPGLEQASEGPLRSLLETLQLPDFSMLVDAKTPAEPNPGAVPKEMPVRGFVCGSDPVATSGQFIAPVSYRGSTGGDRLGSNGAFSAGKSRTLAEVEAADGIGFTAAFSERLVGAGGSGEISPRNYLVTSGAVPADGCMPMHPGKGGRGDAGSSWYRADYRSTLYNHSLPPNGTASCIASDGQSAFMGASSGHVSGVNLLLLDGSLRMIRTTIDPQVWSGFGTIGSPAPAR